MANEASKYCTQCGTKAAAGAGFCVSCGASLGGGVQAPPPTPRPAIKASPVALTVAGLFLAVGTAALLAVFEQGETAARAVPGSPSGAPTEVPANVPAGHPSVELPADVVRILDDLREKAEAAPDDLEAWTNFARATYRAGRLDHDYFKQAAEAFDHVLELAPDNKEAVRMRGNIAYEQRDYAAAAKDYQRYLELDPGHAGVATDLGSALLFQGKTDEAVAIYRKVLTDHPDFVPAHVNLGIALHGDGRVEEAQKEFDKAKELAKTPEERAEVERIIAAARGAFGAEDEAAEDSRNAPSGDTAANGESSFQRAADRMLHSQPILGEKIAGIEWTGAAAATVRIADFPMDQMPDVMRNKFKATLNGKLASLAGDHGVGDPISVDLVDDASGRVLDHLDGKEFVELFDESRYQ